METLNWHAMKLCTMRLSKIRLRYKYSYICIRNHYMHTLINHYNGLGVDTYHTMSYSSTSGNLTTTTGHYFFQHKHLWKKSVHHHLFIDFYMDRVSLAIQI